MVKIKIPKTPKSVGELVPKKLEELKKEGVGHGHEMMAHIEEVLNFLMGAKGTESLKMIMDITGALSKVVEKSNEWLKRLDKGD